MPRAALAKPKPESRRLFESLLKIDRALERDAGVLRLEAVVVVEPALERVPARDLGHADRDVLRPVDVQPAGIALVWRSRRSIVRADAAAPVEDGRQVHRRAIPERWRRGLHDLEAVALLGQNAGVRVDHREAGHRREPVGRVVDQDAVLVAASELVTDEPVCAFDEGRRAERVVHGDSVVGDERIRSERVREALDQARPGEESRALAGVLAADTQLG